MLDRGRTTPLYEQLAAIIAARIKAGEIRPGQRIPSEYDLGREFGVGRTTVRRATRKLTTERLIYVIDGEGMFAGADPVSAPRAAETLPPYRQIAADLAARIRAGEWLPGRRLPSEGTLEHEYDAATDTIRRALAVLRQEGWAHTVARRGTYVQPADAWPSS